MKHPFGKHRKSDSIVEKQETPVDVVSEYLETLLEDITVEMRSLKSQKQARSKVFLQERKYEKSKYFLGGREVSEFKLYVIRNKYSRSRSPVTIGEDKVLLGVSEIYSDPTHARTIDVYYEDPFTHIFAAGKLDSFCRTHSISLNRRDLNELKDIDYDVGYDE